jgi:hypothetical protein
MPWSRSSNRSNDRTAVGFRTRLGYSLFTVSSRANHRALRAGSHRPGSAPLATHLHGKLALQIFAFTVAAGVMLVSVVAPNTPEVAQAEADTRVGVSADVAQTITVQATELQPLGRDSFAAKAYVPPAPPKPTLREAPAAGVPDPGTAQAIAYDMVMARGWGAAEFDCLVALWNKESGWNVYAHNTSSGAYGIPQSLPGDKMASAGADWATNPATQITWGLGYIQGRYQTPCGAYGASQVKGWY